MTLSSTVDPAANTSRWSTRWLLPGLLAAITLTLYLHTLSGVHTFDALSYVRDVNGRSGFFFHPHQLLYSPTGWLFWQAWRLVGYRGDSAIPLETLNALAGTFAVLIFYRTVLRVTKHPSSAVTAAGLLAFNYGFWYFSVDSEVYLLPMVWLTLALNLFVRLLQQPRHWHAIALGFVLGFAALYHQTNALLAPVVAFAIACAPANRDVKVKYLAITAAISAAVVAIGYGYAAIGFYHFSSWTAFHDWLFFFVQLGWWGQSINGRWADLMSGLGNSISTQTAPVFWLLVIALLALGLRPAIGRWPRLVGVAAVWLAIYGAFFFWWEGANSKFWVATLLPFWLLVGLSLSSIRQRRIKELPAIGGVVLVAGLAWHNWDLITVRVDPRFDLQRHYSAAIHAKTAHDDLILTPGGPMELYLPYYEARPNVQTLDRMMIDAHDDPVAAIAMLRTEVDRALAAGYAVIVDQDLRALPPALKARYHLSDDQLAAVWQPYASDLKPVVQHDTTTAFWKLPSASELATTSGWNWRTATWGWKAGNVGNATTAEGWCFDPAVDPNLISPPLAFDAAQFNSVEITLATRASHQVGQLFYAGPDGKMDDAHSVTWQLTGNGQSTTYRIPLPLSKGWGGTITRLRLDPVAAGDAAATTHTCVFGLRLIP